MTVSRSKSEVFRLFGIKKVSSQISLAFCGVQFQIKLYPTHSCNSDRATGGGARYMSRLEYLVNNSVSKPQREQITALLTHSISI